MLDIAPKHHPLPRPSAAVPGLRRVEQLRVIVGGGNPIALVTAVAHRYPREFRVTMATAARLADAGVPVRIENRADRRDGRS